MGTKFKFLEPNKVNTTGTLNFYRESSVSTNFVGTLTALFDRDINEQLVFTASSTNWLELSLSSELVSSIALQNINFKNFRILVNSATVNPTNHDTNASYWTTWADNNLYIDFATVTGNTIQVQVYSTTSGDAEIGQWICTNQRYELAYNPSYNQYKPVLDGNRFSKKTADGGFFTYQIKEKFSSDIKLTFVPASTTAELRNIYNTTSAWYFVPFPTQTSWDGDAWEVNWIGDYQFKQNAYNTRSTPFYNGTIRLRETPL